MEEVVIRLIEFNSKEYLEELILRDKILRKPLGLSLKDDNLESENHDIHLGAFINDVLVGTLILSKKEDHYQMRQVAVEDLYQRKSIGKKLVEKAEELIKDNEIKLHARQTAIEFYEKLGYEIISDEYFERGIPHKTMRKKV